MNASREEEGKRQRSEKREGRGKKESEHTWSGSIRIEVINTVVFFLFYFIISYFFFLPPNCRERKMRHDKNNGESQRLRKSGGRRTRKAKEKINT